MEVETLNVEEIKSLTEKGKNEKPARIFRETWESI